jgi:hypothetical protein
VLLAIGINWRTAAALSRSSSPTAGTIFDLARVLLALRERVSEALRLKALDDENRRLKKLLAEAVLDVAALKDLLAKN